MAMDTTATGPPQSSTPPPSGTPRSVWIALILITAVIAGMGAGLLAFASGAHVATAVLTGGGAFAGTVLLLLALFNFASGKSP
jgi:hypothetical protein